MSYDIIDFHTHPYMTEAENLCAHKDVVGSSKEIFLSDLEKCGITKFAGSVITKLGSDDMKASNNIAYRLKDDFADKYIMGIQVDPRFVDESVNEIDAAIKNKINLIGELVPYAYGWSYASADFRKLLDAANPYGMTVSLHTVQGEFDAMEDLARCYPDLTFVFAHPGEYASLVRHIEIMKKHDNVYLDLSGTGLFRFGMLKRLVGDVGAERILFGTDYPICNPNMYVNAVLGEHISDSDKELIFSLNAKRILKI